MDSKSGSNLAFVNRWYWCDAESGFKMEIPAETDEMTLQVEPSSP
ncbi:MAG: hypothetical protein ABSB13_11135 [Candidatus Binatus sp.]|jgi:hypothetical protein